MSAQATLTQQPRSGKKQRTTPASAGLPDPRPVTDFDVSSATVGGKLIVTVNLKQPCVIRSPSWSLISSGDGTARDPAGVTAPNNTTIVFDFGPGIATEFNFLAVPYQDMQVQNFQGGFVRSGAVWFRSPK